MTLFSLLLLSAPLLAAPAPSPQQPGSDALARLTTVRRPSRPPQLAVPPARPSWGRDEEYLLRLGFENIFLEREHHPVLDPASLEVLTANLGQEGTLQALAALAAAAPQSIPLRYRLTRQQGSHGPEAEVLLEGREAVPVGELVVLADRRIRRALVDFDVEIAQGTAIADPIVASIVTGTTLALELRPLPDGSWLLELLIRTGEEGRNEAIHLGYTAMEGLSRNPVALEEAGLVARLVPGTPATWTLPGREGSSLVLELTLEGGGMAQEDPTVLYLPTLAQPPVGFQAPPLLGPGMADYLDEDVELPQRPDLEQVLEKSALADQAWGSVLVHEASGALILQGGRVEEVATRLREAALESARTREVELRVIVAGSREGAERALLSFRGPLTLDTWAGFAAGEVREVVSEWDVEVACSARVADPSAELVEDGVRGSLRLRSDGQVDLDLDLSVLEDILSHAVTLGHAIVGANEGALPLQPEERLRVEEPVLRRMHLAGSWSPAATPARPGGVIRLERSATGLFGPGSRVVVEIILP